jgi:hypothetical protein
MDAFEVAVLDMRVRVENIEMKRFVVQSACSVGVVATLITCAVPAMAGDPPEAAAPVRLGEAGQIALSSDLAFSMSYTTKTAATGNVHRDAIVSFLIGPAADYFLANNISVGGIVQLLYVSQGSEHSTGLGLAPRVGYLFPMSDKLSFWPKASVGYFQSSTPNSIGTSASVSQANPTADAGSLTRKVFQVGVFAPLTYELAPHFFVGLGPVLSVDLWAKNGRQSADKATTFGISSVVGGYF